VAKELRHKSLTSSELTETADWEGLATHYLTGGVDNDILVYTSALAKIVGKTPAEVAVNIIKAFADRAKVIWWYCNNWGMSAMIDWQVSGSGNIAWYATGVYIRTGATSGSYVILDKGITENVSTGIATWDKNRFFYAVVKCYYATSQRVGIVTGWIHINTEDHTEAHIGFKVMDNILYGTVANGTSESTLEILNPINTEKVMVLEAYLTAGQDVKFYLDGVYKGLINTNLPTNGAEGNKAEGVMLCFGIRNTVAENREARIYEACCVQEAE